MDSGAFSAFTQRAVLSLNRYSMWLQKYQKYLTHYAVLDVIGDAAGTWINQQRMEKEFGLRPVPCYHYGEPESYLVKYLDKYDYIALGGMVPIETDKLQAWLDFLWERYLTGTTGRPRVRVHGFGMTTFSLMKRYPWYSVDSSSWLMGGRAGTALFPIAGAPTALGCSEKSFGPGTVAALGHYQKSALATYVRSLGTTLEELETSYVARNLVTLATYEHWRHQQTMPRFMVGQSLFAQELKFYKVGETNIQEQEWDRLQIFYAGEWPGDWRKLPNVPRMFTYHTLREKLTPEFNAMMHWKDEFLK